MNISGPDLTVLKEKLLERQKRGGLNTEQDKSTTRQANLDSALIEHNYVPQTTTKMGKH